VSQRQSRRAPEGRSQRTVIAQVLTDSGIPVHLPVQILDGPETASARIAPKTIVGAGIAGVAAAVRLKAMGMQFTVFERSASVGGVWRDNRYPGPVLTRPATGTRCHPS
jgi:NADPH-dependent 2,4-dienoyl-CoA reductase/sulfur reductase-like enzyme